MLRKTDTRALMMALMLLLLMPLSGCKDKEDSLETDRLQSIEIKYAFTLSEEMLDYFNITAMYKNPTGESVGVQIDKSATEITTTANKFPAQMPLYFIVTRKDVPAPTLTPIWSTSISISVIKRYYPSGNVETSSKNDAKTLSPNPEYFNEWSEQYIKTMATGYSVTIGSDGSVTF